MTITAESRNRLTTIRERTHNARAARSRARETLEAANGAGDQDAAAIASLALDSAQVELETSEQLEGMLLSAMAGVESNGYGDSLLDDPVTIGTIERLASTSHPASRVELGPLESPESLCERLNAGTWGPGQTMAASLVPDTTVGRRGPFSELGIVAQPRRRLRLLDLIPSSPAVGNSVPYVIESGNFDTAAETAEATPKVVGDIGIADSEVPIRTIAHYLKSPRQVLADVPGLEQLLRDRLAYGALRRLETQILGGSGTGVNIRGILNTSGIGSVAFAAGTPLGDLALTGLVTELQSEVQPDAVCMNPATLGNLLTPKATTSGMYLNIDSPFGTGPQDLSLWGVPVITSTVMAANTALFGAFGLGARLWIREAVNVILGLDSDDLTNNRVTLLGEMRAGVTVNVPSYFTLVHLA